ncbi:MAG: hypothetical protein K2Y18_04685 [Alphaproteobacteria bacterium]|jgi:hypothetical protein|nr:hypothetical protein [Alphaproteobacteria bacterium]
MIKEIFTKRVISLFIALILVSIATWKVMNKIEHPTPSGACASTTEALYITPKAEVTDAVVRLMGLTGIRIANDALPPEKDWPEVRLQIKSRDVSEVAAAVQGKIDPAVTWFGVPKTERWEADALKPKLSRAQADHIVSLNLETLHQAESMYPTGLPNAVFFLGSTLGSVRKRLAFLNELYESKKLSPDLTVYVLTGERKLDEKVGETTTILMDPNNALIPFRGDWAPTDLVISDEAGMIKLVFSQSRHASLDENRIKFVYSSKGDRRRANTEGTIVQWLKEFSPSSGMYVAISNQPYNFYQECVIRRVLLQAGRPDICVRVIGPGKKVEDKTDAAVIADATNLLDNVSRILYELSNIKKALPS